MNTLLWASLRIAPCFEPKLAATNAWRSISIHVRGFRALFQNSRAFFWFSAYQKSTMKVHKYEDLPFNFILIEELRKNPLRIKQNSTLYYHKIPPTSKIYWINIIEKFIKKKKKKSTSNFKKCLEGLLIVKIHIYKEILRVILFLPWNFKKCLEGLLIVRIHIYKEYS